MWSAECGLSVRHQRTERLAAEGYARLLSLPVSFWNTDKSRKYV
nr:MAG TPA: hypothetical protein [Caudoviricetes sp.]